MNMPCSIVKDLLPLYVEGMVSKETKAYVEKHLIECENCKKALDQMRQENVVFISGDTAPLKKIKNTMQRKKAAAVAFAVIFTLIIALLGFGYLLAPQAVPYEKEMFSFATYKNDALSVRINRPVSSWYLEYVTSEELGGKVCYLSAWTNNLIKLQSAAVPSKEAVIKEKAENLVGVYYTPNDGSEDILIYGKGTFENVDSITLPRLTLAYYFLIAAILAIILGLAIFINRQNKPVKNLLLKIGYIPFSYLIAHFLVKGLDARTYTLMYDLCSILIIAMLVYGLCLLLNIFLRKDSVASVKF